MREGGRDIGVGAPPLVVDSGTLGEERVVGGVVVPHVLVAVGPVGTVVGCCVAEREKCEISP